MMLKSLKAFLTQTRLVIAVIVALGLGLTAGLFLWARQESRDTFTSAFQAQASSQSGRVRTYLDARLIFLDDLARHLALTGAPSVEDFRAFVDAERSRVKGIRALEWAPRVTQAQRPGAEAKLRGPGPGPQGFTERGDRGVLRSAGARAEYFPVSFLEPMEGNRPAFGYDLGSEPARHAAIVAARDSGAARATEPLWLVQEQQQKAGFLVFVPVYAPGRPARSVAERRAAFRGVVLGVFLTADLMDAALGGELASGLDGAILDPASAWRERPIHGWGAPEGAGRARPGFLAALLLGTSPSRSTVLAFAGRSWEIRLWPDPRFAATYLHRSPLIVIPVGLLLTAMLVQILHLAYTQKQRAERLVEERGAELVHSLALLRTREERLRLLLDSTAEAIYGIDLQGKCTFCNTSLLKLLGYARAEDVIGRNMHTLIHHTHPDGSFFAEADCRIFKAFRLGEGTFVDDEVIWKADGTSLPVEYWSYPQRRDGMVVGAVVTFVDIGARKEMECQLREKDRLLDALCRSVMTLQAAVEIEPVLRDFLATLGLGARASRCFIFRTEPAPAPTGEISLTLAEEWCEPGIRPQAGDPAFVNQPMRQTGLGRWADQLLAGNAVYGELGQFPEREQAYLEALGVRSRFLSPVEVRGKWWGMIGFDQCAGLRPWSTAEMEILQLAAQALGSKIERLLTFHELKESWSLLEERVLERTRNLVQANQDLKAEVHSRLMAENRLKAITSGLLQLGTGMRENLGTLAGLLQALTRSERAVYLSGSGTALHTVCVFPEEPESPAAQALLALLGGTREGAQWDGLLTGEAKALELPEAGGGPGWTALAQAIRTEDDSSGFLVAVRPADRPWGPEDHAVLGILSAAAGIEERRWRAERESRHAQAQLHQTQKLESVGRLAAGIAHEINTPLQYISLNMMFLRETYDEVFEALGAAGVQAPLLPAGRELDLGWVREETLKVLADSMEGVDQVVKIVRAMKEFSHPGSPDPVPVDVNRCLESAATVSRNEWKYVSRLALELDPELPLIQGFPAELNQVFLNLIVNAAQAIGSKPSPDGELGEITIATAPIADGVEIRIRDTGIGIAPENQGKVFDPFFTTKEVGVGTGQGLMVSYQTVVQSHGGKLFFQTTPGEETTFIVQLPFRKPTARKGAPKGGAA